MARFMDLGLAHRVDAQHGSRFGAGGPHPHAVCPHCDRVDDLPALDPDGVRALGLAMDGRLSGIFTLTVQSVCDECWGHRAQPGDQLGWHDMGDANSTSLRGTRGRQLTRPTPGSG